MYSDKLWHHILQKGQDPSTIVRTKAPMGDFYTVPDKKRVDASIGQEVSYPWYIQAVHLPCD